MKPTIFIYAVCSLFASLIMASASSQTNTDVIVLNIRASQMPLMQHNDAMPANTATDYRNDINIKAVRKFIKDFKDADNVTWTKINDGSCMARFTSDSIQTTITYDKRGTWNYTLKRYAEDKMPADVRNMVKSIYYDYVIAEVTEIKLQEERGNVIYNVLIKYAGNCKILQIHNNQMEIINEYTKP